MINEMQININKKIISISKASNRGYAILFVVLLASIILSMTVGIANIALKEVSFSASAKDSHVSFFAADTAGECAIYSLSPLRSNPINPASPPDPMMLTCESGTMSSPQLNFSAPPYEYDFKSTALTVEDGCAYVHISIDPTANTTTVTSHGFNTSCTTIQSNNPSQLILSRQVERVLTYTLDNS